MPASITLPQVVLELEEEDRKRYEALKPPASLVVRYGYMKCVGEFPYDPAHANHAGPDHPDQPADGVTPHAPTVTKPGCGSKLVVRTPRGIELGEMLTTTCANAGCGSSVSRKEMLQYIENSGGKDYPFTTDGRVLRVATTDDLSEQARLDAGKLDIIRTARQFIVQLELGMKLVEVELLLGGERLIFHYTAEKWVDFRELVKLLAAQFHTRIEMHQVNARDEARLVADYEKCGQHCCCKQFLKVLKPVSMRSAKVQKATLDPTKISGRCGRLMCCLRYEDATYEDLRKRLPHRNTRVLTAEGPGTVLDTQILTQLVLVRLDKDPKPAAYPLENIQNMTKEQEREYPRPLPPDQDGGDRDHGDRNNRGPRGRGRGGERGERREPRPQPADAHQTAPDEAPADDHPAPIDPDAASDAPVSRGYNNASRDPQAVEPRGDTADSTSDSDSESESEAGDAPDEGGASTPNAAPPAGDGAPRRRRRRRRRSGGGRSGGDRSGPGNGPNPDRNPSGGGPPSGGDPA